MNGAPYYSAPHRHQKSYMSRLGTLAECALRPELAELPALVAAAIRQGLIQQPDPRGLVPRGILQRGPLAEWQTTVCDECGVTFARHKRTLTRCNACRTPLLECGSCGKKFRSVDKKKIGCSAECSQKMQVANLKAQHQYSTRLPNMAECIICHQVRPVRPAGSGVAKTCSPECAKEYRAIRNAERKTK